MAQNRKLTIAGLNIVTHPHSPQGYVDLFKSIYRLKKSLTLRTTQRIMIGELGPINSDNEMTEGIFGRIYRFDQIDPNAHWFNVEKNKIATEDELAAIAIPEELKPNLAMFDFVFYPKGHKLYFVTKQFNQQLSPGSLNKFFEFLFTIPEIMQKYGKVEITVMPDVTQLNKILSLHRLSKLSIDLIRPNPDDNSNDEDEVFKRLDKQGARRMEQVLTAEAAESIKPDHDTKVLAKVASTNGKVTAIGYLENGQRVEESTTNIPWKVSFTYNPDKQVASDALISHVANYR